MAHILVLGGRDMADDAEELVLMNEVPPEVDTDIKSLSVPSDAAFLKFFTPKFISSTSKPCYLWSCREFEANKDQPSIFPAYSVTGYGLLDACLHAHATNAILVLHPLDILLHLCYIFGNQRKKSINHNNEELKKITQIRLRRPFNRPNLILATVARLARRIETYPLPKLFRFINTEMNSSDPFVVRLVLSILCYLAGTKETTRLTVEHMRSVFGLVDSSDVLMESPVRGWQIAPSGMLDLRHDPNATASRRPHAHAKNANVQQVTDVIKQGINGEPTDEAPSSEITTVDFKNKLLDGPTDSESTAKMSNVKTDATASSDWGVNSKSVNNRSSNRSNGAQTNNANRSDAREAAEWTYKKVLPVYKLKRDNGVHSVLFKGNRRAWLELPEMMQELCQFFLVEKRVQTELLDIGVMIQMSRLNTSRENRKFWLNMIFKDNIPKVMPDGDLQIDGWLSTLLGARINEQNAGQPSMLISKLCTIKLGIRLPVLLVRLPKSDSGDATESLQTTGQSPNVSDDSVVDGTDVGRRKTRLAYYDEYREKLLLNNSGTSREIPVGLFLPWRSCEAVNNTRRLWRHVGGDYPTMNESEHSSSARNRNNTEAIRRSMMGARSQPSPVVDEAAVRVWSVKNRLASKSGSCCSCRSKRPAKNQTEPAYNMCCLLSGMCGFCLEKQYDTAGLSRPVTSNDRTLVRPLCFFEIVFED